MTSSVSRAKFLDDVMITERFFFVDAIDSLVQNYLQKLLAAISSNSSASSFSSNLFPGNFNNRAMRIGGQLTESQLLSLLQNAAALIDDLVPHSRMQLEVIMTSSLRHHDSLCI
jgi:hypothetical protein